MPEFTVSTAEQKKKVDGRHGPMQVITLTFAGGTQAEWFTKADTPLPATGAVLEGDVTDGPYGKNFKKASSAYGGRSPRDSRRIERQHSQEMALRFLAGVRALEGFGNPEAAKEAVKHWTDWFVADLDVAGGGAGTAAEDGAESLPTPVTAASSAISDKQKAFLERLLKEKGADSEQVNLIGWWAGENLTGGRDGSASKAIDGLTGENPDGTLARLLEAALKWQRTQSDVPADTEGLDEAEGQKALDDIPF